MIANLKYVKKNYINIKNFIIATELAQTNMYTSIEIKLREIVQNIIKQNTNDKPILLSIGKNLHCDKKGGGEVWLYDVCYLMKKNFFNIILSINDNFNENEIDHCLLHSLNVVILNKLSNISSFINLIKPNVINHQGFVRKELVMLSSCININFVTHFCFWNDMLDMKKFTNINMISNEYEKHQNFDMICKYSNASVVSQFMNDILKKTCNIELPIIESISLLHNYKPCNEIGKSYIKYVTLANCHPLKGGYVFKYLLEHLDSSIPLMGIITENHDESFYSSIKELIKKRNQKNNINVLHESFCDMKNIYKDSLVILLPSIVDETFCKVAYEAKMNDIYTVSFCNGNLKYLLSDHAKNFYIQNDYKSDGYPSESILLKWAETITQIYKINNCDYTNTTFISCCEEKKIKEKLLNIFKKPSKSIELKNIGFFCPFYDQGLGIQTREYYYFLKQNNIDAFIFSHKSYFSKQNYSYEWDDYNVYYSKNTRENIEYDELLEFVFTHKIKTFIIPEICYKYIYRYVTFLKSLGLNVYCIVNIETSRCSEFNKYYLFDKILTNNPSSYEILSSIFQHRKQDVILLEFNNHFLKKRISWSEHNLDKANFISGNTTIKFITIGGYNAFFRKNIKHTYDIFNVLEKKTNINFELTILSQQMDKCDYEPNNTEKIKFIQKQMSYEQIIDEISQYHIYIHMGNHEGLGLGFYEALNLNIPIITLNTHPNTDIVHHNINGWVLETKVFKELEDNNEAIINMPIIDQIDYYKLIITTFNKNNLESVYDIIVKNKHIYNNYEKTFINLLQ